jgi:hypothetical protein
MIKVCFRVQYTVRARIVPLQNRNRVRHTPQQCRLSVGIYIYIKAGPGIFVLYIVRSGTMQPPGKTDINQNICRYIYIYMCTHTRGLYIYI